MELMIHKSRIDWSDALARHTQRRVADRLGRLESFIRRVLVRFVDVNGPRGGVDKRCAVTATLSDGSEVVIRSHDACPSRAIDDASRRLQRVVRRHRDRRTCRRSTGSRR